MDRLPRRLADFEVIRRLGAGGMAEVFLAKKRGAEGTFKLLVVKRVLPRHGSSHRFRTMFAEEAQLATRLNHPNIVQVYEFVDSGEEGQLLSMEYVEGPDLKKLQRAIHAQSERLPPYVAAYIVSEVAKGLHYAHQRKDERGRPLEIVHRDVSPQNILLSFEGAVKIADFGIATANVFREEPGILKGKTSYMSPEQARGEKVDRRTDIYSLGVVLHELLTGRPIHGGAEGHELLEAVRAGNIEPPSMFVTGVPAELETITMTALSRPREHRFQSAREMAAAITRALFQSQTPVDSQVVDSVIAQYIHHEHTSPGTERETATSGTSHPSPAPELIPPGERDEISVLPGFSSEFALRPARLRVRAGREVRHVAVVTLRIHHLEELHQAIGNVPTRRLATQLTSTLGEIAFKSGARWVWETTGDGEHPLRRARAVVGLMANPQRAAADAARLAVDVHEAIHGACDGLPVELKASVGIVRGIASGRHDSAGHLVQHTLHRPANKLADLLGERASAGQTWVAGGLYRLVRRDFVWSDAPSIEIQNADEQELPRNMRVYVLERPLTREEKLLDTSEAARDLVGRDAELADLHAAYHQLASGDKSNPPGGATVQAACRVIIGELGIGKTALVNGFVAELPDGTEVLRVECSPSRRDLPFATLGQWLRELTGIQLDDDREQAQQTIAKALGDLAEVENPEQVVRHTSELAIGKPVEAADEADATLHRRLLSTGVQRFFTHAAERAPHVVLIDGIQWADLQSLELITGVLRRLGNVRLLTILVARPDDRLAPFLEGIVRVDLKGLSPENQVRLIQAHVGAVKGVAQVCADLIPKAGGNPFFLLEMVDALLERGSLELRDDSEGSAVLVRVERPGEGVEPLPSTLEQLIADRLNELPMAEHAIIDWLAVAGGPLSERDLAGLAGHDSEEAIARLFARGLCDPRGDTVDVRHPLTRDVAYLALEHEERMRMHRRLGQWLAETPLARGLGAAIVARHLAQGGDSEAAHYYLQAARAARQSYQLQLAVRYFRRVLATATPTDPSRLEAHAALEGICRIQGRWRDRRRYLVSLRKLARRSETPHWVATALIQSARFDLDAGQLARGLTLAQQGEVLARQSGSSELEIESQLLIAEMLRDLGDMQGALAACDRALSTASQRGIMSRLRAEVLHARGRLLRRVGRVQEAVAALSEAIAVFKISGARRLEARAKNSLAFNMFVMAKFEDAIALALEAIRIDLAIGGRFQIAKTLSNIGQAYAQLGDMARAQAYLRRSRDAHQRYGDQDGRAGTLLATAEILLEIGDREGAEELVRDAAALSAVSGSAFDTVHERILRALLARAHKDPERAVSYAFEARQVAEAQAYVAFHFFAMAIEAVARVELGEHHTGILLATTTMGAIETVQGSEYGIQTRAVCCEALNAAGSLQAEEMRLRAAKYIEEILASIRDQTSRERFLARAPIKTIMTPSAVSQKGAE